MQGFFGIAMDYKIWRWNAQKILPPIVSSTLCVSETPQSGERNSTEQLQAFKEQRNLLLTFKE
jgi:hypothetical protein